MPADDDADADDMPGDLTAAKTEHEWIKVERARLELDRARGLLIDADDARREAFARGRAERDAWLSWVHRTAPLLAAELQANEHAVFAALEREVTDQLTWLADTPLVTEGADDGND